MSRAFWITGPIPVPLLKTETEGFSLEYSRCISFHQADARLEQLVGVEDSVIVQLQKRACAFAWLVSHPIAHLRPFLLFSDNLKAPLTGNHLELKRKEEPPVPARPPCSVHTHPTACHPPLEF
ncbi:hypothetical protein XENTR_v10020320 [Xenopus tropicalis]|nr:hypothetical protein XENTR_v10020320 [Xenopus tropicalis]